MDSLFRVKIASKRQVTIPQRMLNLLGLEEGDELHFTIREGHLTVQPMKMLPADLFTADIRQKLAEHEKAMIKGRQTLSLQRDAAGTDKESAVSR